MSQQTHQIHRRSFSERAYAFSLMATAGVAVSIASAAGPETGFRNLGQGADSVSQNMAQLKNAPTGEVISGRLIVQANSLSALNQAIAQLQATHPTLRLVSTLEADYGAYLLETSDAASAIEVSQAMLDMNGIRNVRLERATDDLRQLAMRVQTQTLPTPASKRAKSHQADMWPGVTPLPSSSLNPRGGFTLDPLFGSQWHFINGVNADRDNNIPATIYTTDGLSGMGINVGLANFGQNTHIDTDHTELDANFKLELTMPFDPNLFPDNTVMTSMAGLLSGEFDSAGIQGIVPNASFGNFDWPAVVAAFPLIEHNAFDWLSRDLDIRVYDIFFNYDDPAQALNAGSLDAYATTPLRNSYAFGRGRKGLINIFGTGINSTFGLTGLPKWPDPYNFPPPMPGDSWSPLDEILNSGNEVSVSLTNGYSSGPFYPNGQITNYPPANDRRSFVFQTVAEDGFADIYSAFGTSIFASFYGGTTNQFESGSQAVSGLGVLTAIPGASNVGFFPAAADVLPSGSETMSGATIGAGVIALMLEENPNLTIRDIQHILFESIQESTKPANVKWPNFDINRFYLGAALNGNSFWQVNSALYSGGPVANQAIRHSDIYGFGVVDAEVAIQKATNWQRVPRLVLLDTGHVGSFNDENIDSEDDIMVTIPDAAFVVTLEADGTLGIPGAATLVPNGATLPTICVRQNIQIECIVLELTVEGDGNEDLIISLTSPSGSSSVLKMTATNNFFGTSFDEVGNDDNFDLAGEVNINGTDYSLYRHAFLSWKHWGELSGGEWNIAVLDLGPDDVTPEGAEPGTGMMPDPGADMVTTLGAFGVPGSEFRSEKTVTGYRFQIFGTEAGLPIFEGCAPGQTSCPGDLDGNGIIDIRDMQLYISWYLSFNALADIDQDGDIDYNDLFLFRQLWIPGFCNDTGIQGGRPRPGNSDAGGDNNPDSRPI